MKIRVMGSVDLLKCLAPSQRIYLNRNSKIEGRIYFDIDDRVAERLIKKGEIKILDGSNL